MKRLMMRVASVVFGVVVALPFMASGQGYPMPGGDGEPPVICSTCYGSSAGLPTYPYSSPIKSFVGRYVDSQATQDLQHGTGYRTVRAKKVMLAPENNRVLVIAGEGLEIFDYQGFFSSHLNPTGSNLKRARGGTNDGSPREVYLYGDQTIYAESNFSGWDVTMQDGQERLADVDFDDRGNIYLAYTVFGWGIHQDNGNKVPKVYQDRKTSGRGVMTLRSGSSYYAIIYDGFKLTLFDTTNVTNPKTLTTGGSGIVSMAATKTTEDRFAFIERDGSIFIYTVQGFRQGSFSFKDTPASGFPYRAVTTDGTNFWASQKGALVKFSPDGSGGYVKTSYPFDLHNPSLLNWGKGGFLAAAVYLSDGSLTARAWIIENGAPRPIDMHDHVRNYYTRPPSGYAKPKGYTELARDVRIEEHFGKVYFFWSGHGLGDVYELQARQSIDIAVNNAAGYGPSNPYSKGGAGPFYGDPISFTGTYQAGPIPISWDFGNPGAPGNTATSTTGVGVSYQYSGLTTPAEITTARTVTAHAVSDTSNTDSVNVSMLTPTARLGVASTDLLFLQPNASSPAPIVLGDSFVDASDGSLLGHYTRWTLDSTAVDRAPNTPQSVGPCGVRSLIFAPQYGPYNLAGSVASHLGITSRYAPPAISLTYTVRPFAAQLAIVPGTGASKTFKNMTRVGAAAGFAAGPGTPVTVTWRHVSSTGTDLVTPDVRPLTLSQLASDTFTIASPPTGSKVVLSVSIDAAQLTDAGCASLVTSSSEFPLIVPDPTFTLTGCETQGQACLATAASSSGQSMTDWSYQWILGTSMVGSGPTVDLKNALQQGSQTLKLKATNSIGTAEHQQTWTVAEPTGCTTPPGKWADFTPSCGSGCAANQPITFMYSNWGYMPQECDVYSWTFGDGTTSAEQSPVKTYSANNTYTVTLKVTNEAGSVTKTKSVTVGGSTQPPPTNPPPTNPPPTGGTCALAPGSNADFSLSCGTNCTTNQSITFMYSNWGYTPQSCDTYSWSFGDGTTGNVQSPQKTYTTAGTYNVTLTVSNSKGQASKTRSVVIGQGGSNPPPTNPPPTGTCTTAPGGSVGLTWTGGDSGCSPGSNCNRNEEISFSGSVFFYSTRSCDSWEWDFGDGTKGAGQNATHKYTSFGTYQVTVKIKNNVGEKVSESKTLLVGDLNVAKPTSVNFTMTPSTPMVGKPVTLVGSSVGGDPVTSWRWTFGDGTVKTGQTVVHTFSTAGPWWAQLDASNGGGAAPPLRKDFNVAAENSYAFLLPVVTHGAGQHGSLWRTDLQIYYPYQGEEVELEFELRSATLAVTKTMRLDRSTLISEDFMSFFTDGDNSGPVIVRGNTEKLPQIWTRTYNVAANGIGTFGQLIPAVRLDTLENSATGPTAYYLPGVRLTDRYRTNIGLLNISGSPITITLTAFENSFGAAIGQFQQTLEPYRFIQIGDGTLRANFAGYPPDKAFSVTISGADEGALIAYESMIDNVSNDPVYVSAVPASLASDAGMKNQIVPGVGHFQSWKSDIAIFNPDDQAIQFDLSFYDEKGVLLSQAQNRILPAKGTLQITDLVNAPEMTPVVGRDVIGTLRLDVDSPLAHQYPVVTDRTYNDQGAAGTYGQGIIGFPSSKPNVRAGKPAILPAVRQDLSYYTNLGLVNVGDEQSTVLVSLLDKQSGQPIGTWSVSLVPGESIVASRILQAINATADSGSLKIEVTSGAPVWAYASVIDQMTKDPEYVPAVPLD